MSNLRSKRRSYCSPTPLQLSKWDRKYVWHPFTQMKEWEEETPLIIEKAKGNFLYDIHGNKYLDGVSSIWTNIHGYQQPEIDKAIRSQLKKVAHSTLLGLSSPPSILLAKELVRIAPKGLSRVFFSDNGSTAVEVAIKMAIQFWLQQEPPAKKKRKFVRLDLAYHGDTTGCMSVSGIKLFHDRFQSLVFPSIALDAPYCYRCPLNLEYPSCEIACIHPLEKILLERNHEIAGVIIEPLVQAVAGIITQPRGYLKQIRYLCTKYNVLMIADEVATGFGRTGKMFACQHEKVTPDLMAVAKGLTGGYLPLAATLSTDKVYKAFLGEYQDFKTFFHGHSYTGNALACVAAQANLDCFKNKHTLSKVKKGITLLQSILKPLEDLPMVGQIRQSGYLIGIELVRTKDTRTPYSLKYRIGYKVAKEARNRGLLIRPIGDTIVIVPPLVIKYKELRAIVRIITESLKAVHEELQCKN